MPNRTAALYDPRCGRPRAAGGWQHALGGGWLEGERAVGPQPEAAAHDECEHMLLYLNGKTWTRGEGSDALAAEREAAAAQVGLELDAVSPLEDGSLLRVGSLALRVFHTPGHSPGSMCIRITNEADGTDLLITGEVRFVVI